MNEDVIIRHLTEALGDVQVQTLDRTHFFFVGAERKFPFVTLVGDDAHDAFSDLSRGDVFRLNIGVRRETFRVLFGDAAGDFDFTALDQLMPHPVYGSMFWVCILNPSDETFVGTVRPLLEEAFKMVSDRQERKTGNAFPEE